MGSCTSQPVDEPSEPTPVVELTTPRPDMQTRRPHQDPRPPPVANTDGRRGSEPGKGEPTRQGKKGARGGGGGNEELERITQGIHAKTQKVLEAGVGRGGLVNEQGYMEVKMLLLGSGESGKSTILKQMKILHGDGFTQAELMQYRTIVRHNLVDSGQALLRVVLQWGYRPELGELPPGWESDLTTENEDASRWARSTSAVTIGLPGTNSFSVPVRVPGEEDQDVEEMERREDEVSFGDMIRYAPEEEGGGYGRGKSGRKQKYDNNQQARRAYEPPHRRSAYSMDQTSTSSEYAYPSSSAASVFPPPPPGEDVRRRVYGSQPTIGSTGEGLSQTVQALLAYQILPGSEVPMWVGQAITQLWTGQPFMRDVLRRSNEFYLMDNAPYFFKHALRICDANYWPTHQDVLRCRVQTRGVTQSSFTADGMKINMYDVGGQRAERKKWIVAFESVKCVIFTAAMSEYDQTLLENPAQNRMNESLELFKNVITSRWFQRAAMVLFLNKMDVFEEKYERSPLKRYFPEYSGTSVESGVKFMLWKYSQMNKNNVRLYVHFTTATDTRRCAVVLAAVREQILDSAIKESGLI